MEVMQQDPTTLGAAGSNYDRLTKPTNLPKDTTLFQNLQEIAPEDLPFEGSVLVQQEQNFSIASEELRQRFIDLSKQYPEIENTLSINGVGCFPIGDIVAIKAKAKQGKSLSITALIVAMIKGQYMGFTALKKQLRVLYVDTEMNPLNTAKLTKKVHKLCGYDTTKSSNTFYALNLRSDNPIDRCKFITDAIDLVKPDAVFIDGIKDLIETDINDQKESGKVTQYLMTLTKTYPIVLIAVLHTNKALTDSNMRGAIGTEVTNKASEVWEVKKEDNIFLVSQDISRNAPADGWSFTLNEWGEPIPMEYVQRVSRTEAKYIKMQENLQASLPPLKVMSYTELTAIYSEIAGLSPRTAQTHIGEAVKRKYIERGNDGNYRICATKA